MSNILVVTAHWSTDAGMCVTAEDVWDGDWLASLNRQEKTLEGQGRFIVKPLRVFVQQVPLLDGKPFWHDARPVERIPLRLIPWRRDNGIATAVRRIL